jgi:ribose 5-phosphate isomerase B
MRIYIASDHAGYDIKNVLLHYLIDRGYDVIDCGPYEYNEADDYPDYVAAAASEVSQDPNHNWGIVIGGSGQGEAIMANRFPNVRAVVYNGQPVAPEGKKIMNELIFTREHNNANVLSLGAWYLSEDDAKNAVMLWLNTPFPGEERHIRRVRKIESLSPRSSTQENI